ncbi:hypothetical protein DFA_10722 [Cavenderia fasciculata]|uniref:ZFYVE26-like TPR repeats domain-containing protein n=1 Tax=Cavenderia fasciculata TaxID=261658 RepID=F4QB77_CACFS|nr:uncharacterized protein DFA_10722 [Cavenderia fasciculata]EGG14849.1 hypothetical protein DFA_10722 [Cavenderia fasciculata]|eukprot:XP_004351365.1 hypothetical protein DFA_10722 [Cavenderia fasciculata]
MAYLKAVQLQSRELLQVIQDEAQKTNQPTIYKWCQEVLQQQL